MPFSTHLTSASNIWAEITFEGLSGVGRIAPVVNVMLGVKTPTEGIEAEAHRLALTLTFEGERISSTELGPIRISSYGSTVAASFPVSPRALTFIGDSATAMSCRSRSRSSGYCGSFGPPRAPVSSGPRSRSGNGPS